MRNDYLKQAQQKIQDPNILINVISRRVKQLKAGSKPCVESLEKLSLEDIALLEVIKDKLSYEIYDPKRIPSGATNADERRLAEFLGRFCRVFGAIEKGKFHGAK